MLASRTANLPRRVEKIHSARNTLQGVLNVEDRLTEIMNHDSCSMNGLRESVNMEKYLEL